MSAVAGEDEVDFGWYQKPTGYQARVSWQRSTECLYLHDGERGADYLLLACDEASARQLLDGYGEAHGSWTWLAERLATAGVKLWHRRRRP